MFFKVENSRNIWIEKHNRYAPFFLHKHEYFEVFFVLEGSCQHTINQHTTTLGQGTFCMIEPGVQHGVSVFDDSIILNIMIQKSVFDDILLYALRSQNILADFFLGNLYATSQITSLSFHIEDEELTNFLLSMLMEEFVEDTYTYRILNYLVSLFFIKLVRKYGKAACNYTYSSVPNKNALKMLSFINAHYKEITLNDLAEQFGYTPEHCSRILKRETGLNFAAFLRNIRMRHAEALLTGTSLSVEEDSV